MGQSLGKRAKMIYVKLRGRIGNQLFIYAMARSVQCKQGKNNKIVIDESEVLELGWVNSLKSYDLKDVEYIQNIHQLNKKYLVKRLVMKFYYHKVSSMNYRQKYNFEKRWQKFFNLFGLILCENGYTDWNVGRRKDIFVIGYFQSELYFKEIADKIKKELSKKEAINTSDYPNLSTIMKQNSVCISIKVEHNIGSKLYDVCSKEYWKTAMDYICNHVENPVFFICSDNIDYVKDNVINCENYNVIYQAGNYPVDISLAIMNQCKHFIIGNTTYGWWAQYLCENEDKIVVAPSKWMLVDMPIDLYQKGWILI